MSHIRPAAVSGFFYPAAPDQLSHSIEHYLHAARAAPFVPKALIVPHAGYVYSGAIAASAYRLLAPLRERIQRVVLLGPAHRVWVNGIALPDAECFDTPLGRIGLDISAMEALLTLPGVMRNTAAHAPEHALEVQLPFLQTLLKDFTLVPIIVGEASGKDVARVLEHLWGGEETLLVISSDLSHYLPYDSACLQDADTAHLILTLHAPLNGEQACGAAPINGLMLAAKRHHLVPHLLDLRNSGDTAGDKARVVGYGAFAFTETS